MSVDLASVEQVFAWLDGLNFPLATVTVAPSRAVGRALLLEFRAPHGLPRQDTAAMDGVAVAAQETLGAGPYNPMKVRAVAVRQGAAMPAGTDAVLPEDAVQDGQALDAAAAGEAVMAAESQLRRGERVFPAGHVLRPQDVALLAELGVEGITVRAGLMVSGNVKAVLRELSLALLWRDLSQWDEGGELVLTTAPLPGDRWDIGGVALRPGGACRFGWRDGRPAICLPGDVLGFTLAYEVFVARLLRRVGGLKPAHRVAEAVLVSKLVSSIGHTDIALVRLEGGAALPLPWAETGGAAGLARADGFVLVPAMREGVAQGGLVTVQLLAP
jgi:molybdopterin molybdotransferase